MRWIRGLLLAGTLVACGCTAPPAAPAPAVTAPTSPAGPPTASAARSPSRSPSVVASPSPGSQAQAAVDAALRDAATHLGVSQADLKVAQVEARQWSDASLGCPRPGVLYAQVVTPGYLIVVTGGAKQLEYHSDERGRVVLCAEQ
jgi:hypothetical protein